MAPGSFNGKNFGGLHSGCGKKSNLGVYSLNGKRYERIPHRKFTPKTMVNIKSMGLRGIVVDKRDEKCPRSLIKVYIPDLNQKRYFYTDLLEIKDKVKIVEVNEKYFSEKDNTKFNKYLENKKKRDLSEETRKEENRKFRKDINKVKDFFLNEINNGLSLTNGKLEINKSKYNIINEINKDRFIIINKLLEENKKVVLNKDKLEIHLTSNENYIYHSKIRSKSDYYKMLKELYKEL